MKVSDTINGTFEVDVTAITPFAAPKLNAINSSSWDEWYFDGVSADGIAGISILLSRVLQC
jgi:hypothetical protein